jgi:protein-disulfide isomerase
MARLSPVLALLCVLHLPACGDDEGIEPEPVENVEVPALITELPGVNVDVLTGPGDRRMWEQLVNDLLSPCGDPVSIAQCVTTEGSCTACRPAANYVGRLVAEGLDRGDVRELYRARFGGDPLDVPIEGAPVKGPRMGAVVTIVEFSDFECPYCGIATPIIRSLVSEFEGQVRVVFKHYPLSGHENALPAAKAAIAAMRQGKFWEMHDLLFTNQEALQASDFDRYAEELGLDLTRFHDDMANPESAALVELNRSEGRRLGVEGTPSIYINGRKFEEPFENLSAYIREEIDARE